MAHDPISTMPETFANNLDRRIYQAVQSRSADAPLDLAGILAFIDAHEKLVMTHEELAGGLVRLAAAGLVEEIATNTYAGRDSAAEAVTISTITHDDYERAVQAYHDRFATAMAKEPGPDDFTRSKLIIRWATADPDAYPTDDEEEAAEAFSRVLDPLLAQRELGEVIGFEIGSGAIKILIFGRETDDDVDRVHATVVDVFKSYGCPSGSQILKCYEEPRREVVADEIPLTK